MRIVSSSNNAEELRCLAIFLFPIVADEVEKTYPQVAEVFYLMAYVFRAYSFESYVDPRGVREGAAFLLDRLYLKMSKAFRNESCTFNVHLLSHLPEWEHLGKAHKYSAYRFERSYAKLKKVMRYVNHYHIRRYFISYMHIYFFCIFLHRLRSIVQAFQRNGLCHNCEKSINYFGLTRQSNDGLIYTENGRRKAYRVTHDCEDGTLFCHEQELNAFKYLCPGAEPYRRTVIDFSDVLVYEAGRVSTELVRVDEKHIKGKYIECEKYIVMVPLEMIHETT